MIVKAVHSEGRYRGFTSCGFTLIEMLVVIGIAAIIIPITLVTTSVLTNGFSENQAMNQINADLALARGLAIRDGRDTALVFMTDENGDTLLQIASMPQDAVVVNGIPQFNNIEERSPDRLSEGLRVVSPNIDNFYVGPYKGFSVRFGTDPVRPGEDLTHFAVRFAPDGTICTVDSQGNPAWLWFDGDNDNDVDRNGNNDNNLGGDENLNGEPDDTDGVKEFTFQPVDILALYSKTEADIIGVSNDDAALRKWIDNPLNNKGKANVIMFNHYTGLVMRAPKP